MVIHYGSPITMVVTNDDFTHWRKIMGAAPISEEERENMKRTITKPRTWSCRFGWRYEI